MKRLLIGATVLALLLSLLGNYFLVRRCVSLFVEQMQVRLDPVGSRGGEPSDVIYFGDSRIAMWAMLPTPNSANRGVGGQTTAQLLLRLDRDVIAAKPKVVVIQAGINDIKSIGVMPERQEEIIQTCVANIRAMVERLRAAGIRVVLMEIWPCGNPTLSNLMVWSDEIHEARCLANALLTTIEDDGVECISCDGLFSSNARTCHPDYCLDTLHLNAKGYAQIDKPVADAVRRAMARP